MQPRTRLGWNIATCLAIGPALLLVSRSASAQVAEGSMYYLESFGPRGKAIADLTWGLFGLSVAVVLIISILVLWGVLARRSRGPQEVGQRLPVGSGGHGVRWIYIGLALTTIALAGSVAWTVVTMAAIGEPPEEPRITIEITGQQWWWEVRYVSDEPSRIFETANEIHIPVGEPVG